MHIQEYVTLYIVDPGKCQSSFKSDVELCVGGIAPRALQATYHAKMVGIDVLDYKFTFESLQEDPVRANLSQHDQKKKLFSRGLRNPKSASRIAAVAIRAAHCGLT